MRAAFRTNVFINCPFDTDYRDIFLGIIFTVLYFGYTPRYSSESSDSSEPRITKILALIDSSKFGIHDLSRIVSTNSNEHYRMNMPFELGLDYSCKMLKRGKWAEKRILVLEEERYRFQKALSDISGSDIKNHQNRVDFAIIAVRDWFINEELGTGASGGKVWDAYNDFQAYLYDQIVEKDGHESINHAQVSEIVSYMKIWLA